MKKMRKLLTALSAAALALSLAVPVMAADMANFKAVDSYQNNFPDVSPQKWYYSSVKTCYEYDLMKGAGGQFRPDDKLTVAQALVMADRIREIYDVGRSTLTNGRPWYRPYVDYALRHNIITSEWDNYDRPVTRGEMAYLFFNAITQDELPALNHVTAIPDVLVDDAYGYEIYSLYRAGVLTGGPGGVYRPNDPIIRAEAAAILARVAIPGERKTFVLDDQPDQPIVTGLWETPVVVVCERNVLVKAVGFDPDGMTGPAIQLMIENNSDAPIQLMCQNLKVNNFMIGDDLYETIPSGQHIYALMVLNQADLDRAAIKGVSWMDLDFTIIENNGMGDIWHSAPVQLKTTYEGDIGGEDSSGALLADQNGILLAGKYVAAGTDFGPELVYYLENNTDLELAVEAYEVAINGQTVFCACYQEVNPQKKLMVVIEPSWEVLGDIGITSWEQIHSAAVSFTITDLNTHDVLLITPPDTVEYGD